MDEFEQLDKILNEPVEVLEVPPELLKLAQKAFEDEKLYRQWYETLSPEEKKAEDDRRLEQGVLFIMYGPGGP